MFYDTLINGTWTAWMAPFLPSQRVFYLYLASAFVVAIGSYVYFSYREETARPEGISKGLFGYIFDKEIWFHRSARQDYMYFVLNAVIYYGIVVQLLLAGHVMFGAMGDGLEAVFGPRTDPVFLPSVFTAVAYTIVVLLLVDLAVWTTHYLSHKIELLWQFHQVHHSAEVLTPMTAYRMHPVDLFFTGVVTAFLLSLAFAVFSYLTQSMPSQITILQVNVGTFLFYLIGYNLRHSQIWVSYPKWLSYILISPAQHQIHHSIEKKHWDKNMGLIFAFWDWVFGTLYVPDGYEKLSYGITKAEPNPFNSVTEIYLKPFQLAWRKLGDYAPKRQTVLSLVALGIAALVLFQTPVLSNNSSPSSVHLEELTWTEVRAALDSGFDTVIVPTGGTEQNGPHVVLGKHNYIIRQAAEDIARQLGGTLVAPVIAYVPEGQTGDSPTEHMRWPGTLSVPESVFESVLEHTARSLATHNVSRILFIGDSAGNQDPQARVATKLTREWAGKGIEVLHVGDYYSANGQVVALVADGFTEEQIGTHAGIRDTSELMAVFPQGVRQAVVPPPAHMGPGFTGEPQLATPEIGQTLLTLKVQAALSQIYANGLSNCCV